MDQISTGNAQIDRLINGGIPLNSIITIETTPDSNAKRFIYQVINENDRSCVYLSTIKPKKIVANDLQKSKVITDTANVQITDVVDQRNPEEKITDDIRKLPSDTIIILDSIDIIEDSEAYAKTLSKIKKFVLDSNSIVFLLCNTRNETKESRQNTYSFSDVIFKFDTQVNSNSLENTLQVPKYNGGDTISEIEKIEFNRSSVSRDTSRDI